MGTGVSDYRADVADGHLIVNPKYLSLEDVMEKILFILKN